MPSGDILSPHSDLEMRQLRHHTKNALQRITALVTASPGLTATPAGRRLADLVERRICLSARVSDALFGLTRTPGPIEERLRSLCEALVELLADPDQVIRVEVACSGACPAALHGLVLNVAQELVGNAVKHGFYARVAGVVRVQLSITSSGTRLVVADDGWGLGRGRTEGEGFSLVRAFLAPHSGLLAFSSKDGLTVEAFLPSDDPHPSAKRDRLGMFTTARSRTQPSGRNGEPRTIGPA